MLNFLIRIFSFTCYGLILAQFEVDPNSLIHPLRFDLMAKYIYAKHRQLEVESGFARALYAAHLLSMNDKFYEYIPSKNSLQDYLQAFHVILDSMKTGGYDHSLCLNLPIWVKKSASNPTRMYYCDGSHRVAAALLFNKLVLVDRIEYDNQMPPYNYRFLQRKKLAEKYLDAMALEYCKLSSKCFLAFIFPRFKDQLSKVESLLGGG